MADIESNIDINIDTSDALASLRALQRQISVFHQSMAKSQAVSNGQLAQMQQNLVNGVNATGNFTASIQRVKTTTESFTTALEKNKLSMGQYFRYAGAATQGFGRLFKNEFDTIEKVARERVKTLQTQYIKLGRDASGAMQAIAVRPQTLDMKDLGTQTAITAQKAQLFNQLMAQGSTNLLNFGKNTQWAGRQLMVGFSIPLGVMGAAAAKEFMKMEEQVIRFQRVYGDFSTSAAQTEEMTQSIKTLAGEFTQYGIAVSKTMGLAADAAAMGKTGADLTAQVSEATRLAVLGGVDQAQALETTTSLTNAFGVATDKLAGKINFLNAVENQTVTSIQDLTQAIPTAGPVVQQLGGDVEDLAFFMTAMKEGGIDAGEGANALKSGLASIINPTEEAKTMLEGFNISIENLVNKNAGNAKGMVIDLANALNSLDPLNRAQAIETMFGKFQFARMSTLFQNVVKEGSQASRVLELTKNSAAELAILSERELAKVADSPMYKFQKAIEDFKAAMAPVGEEFLKAVTPIISFGTDILNKFNEMSDGSKQFLVVFTGAIAGIGPILLMTFGLVSNGIANLVKGFLFIRNVFTGAGQSTNILTDQLNYMTSEQQQAAAVAASLGQVHQSLTQTFTSEAGAVNALAGAYRNAVSAQGAFTGPILTSGGGTRTPGKSVKKFAKGISIVPGFGSSDNQPAMLMPGEAVIPKRMVAKYGPLIAGMVDGQIPGYADGAAPNKKYNVGAAGIRMSLPEHLESLYGKAAAEAELARATAAAVETEKALLAMRERGITVTDAQIKSATQLDRSHMIQVTNEQKAKKEAWGKGAWSAQTGGENNLILGSLKKSERNREVYFDYLKKTGATEKQIATIQEKINKDVALTDKELKIQGKALRAIGADWESGKIGKGAISPTFGMYSGAVGAGQLGREAAAAKQTPAQLAASQRTPAQIKAAQLLVNADSAVVEETKKKTKALKEETKTIEDKAKDPKRVAAGLKAAETRRANAAAALAVEEEGKVKQSRMQRLRGAISPGKVAGAGMAISGLAMGASMMGGPVGDVAGQVMGPMMAISSVASVLQMIPGPAGLVAAGLTAIAVAGFMLKDTFDKAQRAAEDFAKNTKASTESIRELSKASGTVSAGEAMDKRRADAMSSIKVTEENNAVADQYIASDFGKGVVQSVADELKTGGTATAANNIANQMATAIASGAVSATDATAIVEKIGAEIGDSTFALKAQAQIDKLIGPDGQDLKKDPVGVRLKIMDESKKDIKSAGGSLKSTEMGFGGMQAGIGIGAGVGAAVGTIVPGLGTAVGAGAGALLGGLVGSTVELFDYFGKLGTESGAFAANSVIAAQQSQEMLDSLKLEYEQRIDNAKAAGDEAEAARLSKEYEEGKTKLLQANAATYKTIGDNYSKLDDFQKTATVGSLDQQIKDQYSTGPMKAIAEQSISKIGDLTANGSTVEVTLKTAIASGDIDPQTMNNVLGLLDEQGKSVDIAANIITNVGAADFDRISQMASFIQNPEKQADFIVGFENKDPETTTTILDTLDKIGSIGGDQAISIAVQWDDAKFKEVNAAYDKIDEMFAGGQQMTYEQVVEQNIILDEAGVNAFTADTDYFNSLPAAQQKVYVERYLTVYETVSPAVATKWMADQMGLSGGNMLARDAAGRAPAFTQEQAMQAYAANSAKEFTNAIAGSFNQTPERTGPPGGGGGGGGSADSQPEKPPTSFLDDLVKKLRDVQKASQQITSNFTDSWAAISEMMKSSTNVFGGLQQSMRKLGAGEDLINLIAGMSPEEFEQRKNELFTFDSAGNISGFKDMLGTIGKAMRAIALGEFQNKQASVVQTTKDQFSAVQKLVAAGVSYADAYDIVADAATASAIANEDNAQSILDVAAAAEAATAASEALNAAQAVSAENKNTQNMRDLVGYLDKYSGQLTESQMTAILGDQNLQDMVLAMFSKGTFDPAVLTQALNDAAGQAKLDLDIQKLTIPGMEEIFTTGMNNALAKVNLAEENLKLNFEADVKVDKKKIEDAQNKIDDIKNRKNGMDDLEADLTRIADKEKLVNEKYDERYKALDKIDAANQRIANRQQGQLSIAQALASGDIGAAAAAMQQLQAEEAQNALADRRAAMQRAQELELSQLTGNMGMTRKDIEQKILDLKKEIFNLEEDTIEPAQRAIDLRQRELDAQLAVQDEIRNSWEARRRAIDTAKQSAKDYADEIARAVAISKELTDAYVAGEGTNGAAGLVGGFTTTTTTTTKAPTTAAPATTAAPSGRTSEWYDSMALQMYRGDFGNGVANRIANLANIGVSEAEYYEIQRRVNATYYGYATGGMVRNYLASGGFPNMPKIGTDTVPAMLTPGEFVVKKFAVDKFGASNLEAINNGTYEGGSVYNNVYNLSVNVKSESDPNTIARTVLTQIKNVDAQRIRGNRF